MQELSLEKDHAAKETKSALFSKNRLQTEQMEATEYYNGIVKNFYVGVTSLNFMMGTVVRAVAKCNDLKKSENDDKYDTFDIVLVFF